jgi:hypothetical protein
MQLELIQKSEIETRLEAIQLAHHALAASLDIESPEYDKTMNLLYALSAMQLELALQLRSLRHTAPITGDEWLRP